MYTYCLLNDIFIDRPWKKDGIDASFWDADANGSLEQEMIILAKEILNQTKAPR